MAAGYTVESNGDVALSAATTKTPVAIINAATGKLVVPEIGVSFDGVSPTAEPVTVTLYYATTDGTGTSHTIAQIRGATRTVQATAKRNYSAEPTGKVVWKRWLVHPQTGLVIPFPLGREGELIVASDVVGIDCTAPAVVNVQAYMEFEEG